MKLPNPVVLWKGKALWVCNKPHGMLTHGGPGEDSALSRLSVEHGHTFHACHRLDAGTGGALMVALRPEAAHAASLLWETADIRKQYLALVTGLPSVDELRADQALPAAPSRKKAGAADKAAITDVRVLVRGNAAALVLCTPQGGRFHQVRAHLAALGHPVLGDREHHGSNAPVLALHAWTLRFAWNGHDVVTTAPLWEGWLRAASRVGINGAALEDALSQPDRP